MVTWLLDTNACIGLLNGDRPALVARVEATDPRRLALCSVVKAELVYGAMRSARAAANLRLLDRFFAPFVSLPFDDDAARHAGEIRADLVRAGTPIGPNDLLIAAIARRAGLIVVTANTREFERVVGLGVEDWATPAAG